MRAVDVRRPVDEETQRTMLRHMLMARGIDEEAGLLENQSALDLSSPWPGGGTGRFGNGHR